MDHTAHAELRVIVWGGALGSEGTLNSAQWLGEVHEEVVGGHHTTNCQRSKAVVEIGDTSERKAQRLEKDPGDDPSERPMRCSRLWIQEKKRKKSAKGKLRKGANFTSTLTNPC